MAGTASRREGDSSTTTDCVARTQWDVSGESALPCYRRSFSRLEQNHLALRPALTHASRAQDCETHEKCLQVAARVPDKAVLCSLGADDQPVTASHQQLCIRRSPVPVACRHSTTASEARYIFGKQAWWPLASRTPTLRSTSFTSSASGWVPLPRSAASPLPSAIAARSSSHSHQHGSMSPLRRNVGPFRLRRRRGRS